MSLISLEYKDICFTSYANVITALLFKEVNLHTKVKFVLMKNENYIIITSTPGRLLIMETVPLKCNFIYKWSDPVFSKEYVFDIVGLVYNTCGNYEMIKFCEVLMELGFKYASKSGLSMSTLSSIAPKSKRMLLNNARTNIIESFQDRF